MRFSNCILISAVFATAINAAGLKTKFVKFDVESKKTAPLQKRSSEASLDDHYSYYLAKVNVGSDSQEQSLLVDTGSNVLWVINSDDCDSCSEGTFSTSSSTSYSKIDHSFAITYGSGKASGAWGQDTVTVGGTSVSNFRIGVASTYPASFGLLGLSYDNEDLGSSPSYVNLPKQYKNDGLIDKVAFSFYAGDHGDNKGSLLFGAIDKSKYTGTMYYVKMQSDSFTVNVGGVNIDSSSDSVSPQILFKGSHTALIDTGTSVTTLPTDAFNKLISALSATTSGGGYYVDCSLLNENVALNYDFSGVRIKVPIKDLIYQESSTSCSLGVAASDSRLIFGGNAMRAVYAVFDLEDKKVGLAKANSNPGDENISLIQ